MKKLIISFLLVFSYVLATSQNMPAYWVPTTGTNTYTVNITGFTSGYTFKVAWVSFTNGNTGASTIVIGPNNVSAAPIRKWDGDSWEPLVSGDIPTITGGARAILTYNNTGSFFELNLLATIDGVESVSGQSVDNTDPANPVVNAWPLGGTEPTGFSANVVIPGNGFNVTLGQSGDRAGDFRVWSSGTARIDGGTAAGLQSAGDVDMTSNAGILKLGATGHIITDNNATKKGLQTAASGYVTDPRSYTDKEYVDNAISGITGFMPLQGTPSLTGNLTINGAGFQYSMFGLSTFNPQAASVIIEAGAGSESNLTMNEDFISMQSVDYVSLGSASGNVFTQSTTGTLVTLDEVVGTATFSVADSDSPFINIDALGDITFYSVPEYDAAPTLSNDLQLTHKLYVDSKAPLAMPSVTYTANRIAGTADIGKIVYMNVTTANTFTINSGVFPVGTFLNVRVLDEATTAVEGASVTITPQSGSLVLSSSGINVFYQASADVWELYNGSPFTLQNTTLTGLVTWTMGGNGLLLDGGDFAVTGNGGYQFSFDDDTGVNIDFPTNANGDIFYRSATGTLGRLAIGTTGQVLTVSGGGLPSWAAAGGVSDGDKGDITVSASGATWTVDNSTITYAKMQNAAGGTRILGRAASSAGGINEIVATADGQVLRRASSSVGFGAIDLADTDAVTGVLPTANGGSLSGTYTPTLTGELNIDATTAYQCQFSRTGNMVTVSGTFDADVTSNASTTQIGISLPSGHTSNFTANGNCGGTSAGFSINTAGTVMADTSNDRAQVTWVSTTTSNNTYSFQFSYLVQ